MTDKLVERLRCFETLEIEAREICDEAADRIEELEAEVKRRDRNIDMMDQTILELQAVLDFCGDVQRELKARKAQRRVS